MRPNLAPALALLLALTGCGVTSPIGSAPTLNVDGNWQIQTIPGTTAPLSGLLLVGALEGSGDTITGNFYFSDLTQTSGCVALNQPVSFS
jgi:hypothetical protein